MSGNETFLVVKTISDEAGSHLNRELGTVSNIVKAESEQSSCVGWSD